MNAKITTGELAGVEFELSDETIKNIVDKQIPNCVVVGQVYKIGTDGPYMVAAFCEGNVGLTVMGHYAGCYSGNILTGTLPKPELRQLLVEKNAKYLGDFNKLFKRRETND